MKSPTPDSKDAKKKVPGKPSNTAHIPTPVASKVAGLSKPSAEIPAGPAKPSGEIPAGPAKPPGEIQEIAQRMERHADRLENSKDLEMANFAKVLASVISKSNDVNFAKLLEGTFVDSLKTKYAGVSTTLTPNKDRITFKKHMGEIGRAHV